MKTLLTSLVLALVVGCGLSGEPPAAPVPTTCEELPAECSNEWDCQVAELDDGTLSCTGQTCCQTFCQDNGCGRCCAR